MKAVEEKGDGSLGFLGPLGFLLMMIISAGLLYGEWWLPAIVVSALGLLWIALSFRAVKPAFAGLMFQFGSRVMVGAEYLIKKEGWTFICPIVEKIVEVSLRQHQDEINGKRFGESEDAYLERAESFSTAEGVNIFPEIFFSYRVVDPGKVFELGGGIDAHGESLFLAVMLHDLVIGGGRSVMAKMELTKILSRETEDENGNSIPIGEKIRGDIIKTPNFDKLGTELLILRIEDIKFTKDAQDVLNALEEIKKQELIRQSKIIEADMALQVQKRDAKTIVIKAEAELTKARKEALAENAKIAAFVGKAVDGKTTVEDGKAYAQYQVGLLVAESLKTGTKVIVPAGDMSKTIAGLVNVFEASREK